MRDHVFRHPQADGLAGGMTETPRDFLRRLKDNGKGTRRCRLQHPVLAIVDARVLRDFAQVATQQREMVLVVDSANAPQPLHCRLVVEMANECVTGICRQRDDTAAMDDLSGLLDEAQLGIVRMDLEKLAHEKERRP